MLHYYRCEYDLNVLWTRELGHSPFAAAPLITDINADGQLNVIAASFLDEVTVLQGQDGSTLKGTRWPHTFVDVSTHSSPLTVKRLLKPPGDCDLSVNSTSWMWYLTNADLQTVFVIKCYYFSTI